MAQSRTFTLLAAAATLAGCAEANSIHLGWPGPADGKAKVITVDAKQRHLIMIPNTGTAAGAKWRVCAEAAPDAFSAFASSFTGGIDAKPNASEIKAAGSVIETAASFERTQTINLLRESFYRTCERYLSGGLDRAQFIIQAARDQRAMVSILAIEQLTGAVRPKPTILVSPGTSASIMAGDEAAKIVTDYLNRRNAAEADFKAKEGLVKAAEASGGVCETGAGDATKCQILKNDQATALAKLQAAQTGLDNAMTVSRNITSGMNASTTGGSSTQGSGIDDENLNADLIATVANAVVKITANASINEPLMFCTAYLTDAGSQQPANGRQPTLVSSADFATRSRIVGTCLEIMAKSQQADDTLRSASLSFVGGDDYNVMAAYLDPGLPKAEYSRRSMKLDRAAQNLGIPDRDFALTQIVAGSNPPLRKELVRELRAIEDNQAGLAVLNGQR